MSTIGYVTIREYVESFIKDNYNSTPIQFENTPLDVEYVSEYISVTDITDGDPVPFDINGSITIVRGAIVIQIYTELNTGSERGRVIASELTQLLQHESLGNFNFQTPSFDSVEQVQNTDYYQQNLTIPYVYAYGAEQLSIC